MARAIGRLSAVAVSKLKSKGMYADGGGLYLQVAKGGTKSWIFRFMLNGQARAMGLGPVHAVGLADARRKAAECRRLRYGGVDPIEARREQRQRAQLEAATAMTFKACADAYIAAHRAGWRNAKHAAQWSATLGAYAYPVFGDIPVRSVDVALVMKAIEPIWAAKTETASRLRQRIERVLDWATARGYRQGENPARWRGHLENLLPKRSKVQPVEHHRALPYGEIGEFLAAVRAEEGVAARALEFAILTAARTAEAIGARWNEIDVAEKLWTIPPDRIKSGKEHRVPLSAPALAILEKMKIARNGEYVFPGGKPGRPLSSMALLMLLRRMNRDDLTVHGFRSTFRDWAAELTNFPHEVAEQALAHTISNKAEAAYRRGDMFQKRRKLMEAWAKQCAARKSGGAAVVPLWR